MEFKVKNVLILLSEVILGIVLTLLIILNSIMIFMIISRSSQKPDANISKYENLVNEVWESNQKVSYYTNYCTLIKQLPKETSNQVNITVEYHETPLKIETPLNPYPAITAVQEMGVVTSSSIPEIDTKNNQVRLYRVYVINSESKYIEYISNSTEPLLYIVKDSIDNEYLLQPLLTSKKVVSNEYFVKITEDGN